MINIPEGKRGRDRPKKSLDEVIREDLRVVGLTEDMAQDKRLWRDRIKILDHRETIPYLSFVSCGLVLVVISSFVVFVCR